MPSVCELLGYEKAVTCGWLEPMLEALLAIDSQVEFCLLGWDARPCDVRVGRTWHVSFGDGGKGWCLKSPLSVQEKVRQLIAEFAPDIIHINGTEYFWGNMDDSVYGNCPIVISLQGIISACATAYGGGIPWWELATAHLRNVRFWLKQASVFRVQKDWTTARSEQELAIFRRRRYFIGRTSWDRSVISGINSSARYYSVNENLREVFYAVRRDGKDVRRHVIYCSACGYPLKGVHWLLRATSLLIGEFPDLSIRIAAAESVFRPTFRDRIHEEAYYGYLRHLAKKIGMESCIVPLPKLTATEVAGELCKAELFVLPSLCENSPNSLCEAMIVGTPAIATNVGGIPSLLRNGVDGKLVPAGNAEALAEAIRWCFLHPEEAEACARVARETALRRHDPLRNARTLMDVYRQVIKEVGSSAREKA